MTLSCSTDEWFNIMFDYGETTRAGRCSLMLRRYISPEMLKLKREIVRTCGGLPIAIVKLADLLSTKDSTNALQELNQDQQ